MKENIKFVQRSRWKKEREIENLKKRIYAVLAILIFILIAFGVMQAARKTKQEGGTLGLVQEKSKEKNNDGDIQPAPIGTDELLIFEEEGVKMYRNYIYGIELLYPIEWIAQAPAYGDRIPGPPSSGDEQHVLGISPVAPDKEWLYLINVNPSDIEILLSDPDYRWNKSGFEIVERKEITVNGFSVLKLTWSNNAVLYLIEHPVLFWTVTFESPGDKNAIESLEAIISTFKFLDS